MIEARLGAFTRARLWESTELSRLAGPPALRRTVRVGQGEAARNSSLAIEVAVPKGAVISYGLPGGAFEWKQSYLLEASVLDGGDGKFSDPLVGWPETVDVGLPSGYACPRHGDQAPSLRPRRRPKRQPRPLRCDNVALCRCR
jgi:hypothetical protein